MFTPLLALMLALPATGAPLEPPPLPGEPLGAWQALAETTTEGVLTPEEAVRVAVATNRDLAARFAAVDRARGARIAAWGVPNPSAELELVGEGELGLHAVAAEFALSDLILAPLRASPAGARLDQARLDAAAAVIRLSFDARAALYAAQATERRYVAAMQAVEAWAVAVDTSRALLAAGNVPELDVAVQQAEYERARVGLAAIELELVAAREHLSRVLGVEERRALAPLAGPGALDVPSDLEDRAVAASLELAALDAGLTAGTRALTAARTDALVPDFGVYAGSARIGEAWDVEAGVHVTVPLFALGRGEVVALAAERRGLRDSRAQAEVEVRSAAREARARLISAHDRATHFETVVLPTRERVSAQTLLQYNAMQVGIYQLLDARRQELEARAAHAELLAELWTAQAALDALLAGVRVDVPTTPSETPGQAAAAAGGH